MRIISKFSDYYDSAQGMGIDKTRVFVRKKEEIWKEEARRRYGHDLQDAQSSNWEKFKPHISGYLPTFKQRSMYITPFSIVFCGKVYYGIELYTVYTLKGEVREYMYTLDQVRTIYRKHGAKLRKKPKYQYRWQNHNKLDNVDDINRYLRVDSTHEQFLIDKKIAIGAYEFQPTFDTFTVNPCLKDFGFQKVFSPYQAFQELDMFVSGVLPDTDNAMANISDEDLLKGKGFDCYSFKKEPTKHKRKACK